MRQAETIFCTKNLLYSYCYTKTNFMLNQNLYGERAVRSLGKRGNVVSINPISYKSQISANKILKCFVDKYQAWWEAWWDFSGMWLLQICTPNIPHFLQGSYFWQLLLNKLESMTIAKFLGLRSSQTLMKTFYWELNSLHLLQVQNFHRKILKCYKYQTK